MDKKICFAYSYFHEEREKKCPELPTGDISGFWKFNKYRILLKWLNLLSAFYFYIRRRIIVRIEMNCQPLVLTFRVLVTWKGALTEQKILFGEDKHRNPQLSRECNGRSAQSFFTTETSLTSNSVDWIALLFQLILIVIVLLWWPHWNHQSTADQELENHVHAKPHAVHHMWNYACAFALFLSIE